MYQKARILAVAGAGLMAVAAQAEQTVLWWDFLSGGDGARMKKLIAEFNAEHKGEIAIRATTLEWGVPYYTKARTSVAVGEGPDIMTYHASRIPLAVKQGILQEITAADWEAMGLKTDDYIESVRNAVSIGGAQYGVPLDIHPIVLYYNKEWMAKAGLLDDNGLPVNLDGIDTFRAALAKAKQAGARWGIAGITADGNFSFRVVYSLFAQQGGELLTDGKWLAGDNARKFEKALAVMADWTQAGFQSPYADYPAAVALFTSGEAAMMINGVWEVPTLKDMYDQGDLFEWGAVELPALFDRPATFADCHTFVIPANRGKRIDPVKRAAVLHIIQWMANHSLYWATAGHIPAYLPVTTSEAYAEMEPNATYSRVIQHLVFEPKSEFAGVAGPIFDVMSTYLVPTQNGEMDAAEAVKEILYELNDL